MVAALIRQQQETVSHRSFSADLRDGLDLDQNLRCVQRGNLHQQGGGEIAFEEFLQHAPDLGVLPDIHQVNRHFHRVVRCAPCGLDQIPYLREITRPRKVCAGNH